MPDPDRDLALLTLYDVAPLVERKVSWLFERYYAGELPTPALDRPPEWHWCDLRPWLEEQFGIQLPAWWGVAPGSSSSMGSTRATPSRLVSAKRSSDGSR